jgi:hypothetical protein
MIRPKSFRKCVRQEGLSATDSKSKANLRCELREMFMYVALLRCQRSYRGDEGVKVVIIGHINS